VDLNNCYTTIAPGTTYTYRVAAVNAIGQSAYTNTATAIVPALPAAPAITGATAARSGNGERVTVTWSSVAGATGYTIQWSATQAFTSIAGSGTVGNTTTFTTGQFARQTWYIRVIATNLVGQSPPSTVATVAAVGAAAPLAAPAVTRPAGLAVAGVTMSSMFSRSALVGAGVPLVVTVPARAQVLRVRVLTVTGAAAAATRVTHTRVLYRTLRRVKAAGTGAQGAVPTPLAAALPPGARRASVRARDHARRHVEEARRVHADRFRVR
jgi:hypothetical protein